MPSHILSRLPLAIGRSGTWVTDMSALAKWPGRKSDALRALARRALASHPLALELAGPAHRGSRLARALFGRLLVLAARLHLAIDALTLQLLLERPQRLVDIIVANDNLHKSRPTPFNPWGRWSPGKPAAK